MSGASRSDAKHGVKRVLAANVTSITMLENDAPTENIVVSVGTSGNSTLSIANGAIQASVTQGNADISGEASAERVGPSRVSGNR